jgi:hypothetical protein
MKPQFSYKRGFIPETCGAGGCHLCQSTRSRRSIVFRSPSGGELVALGAGICPHVLGDANTGISPFLMPTKRWASMRAVFRSASRSCSRNALRFENGSSYKVDDARAIAEWVNSGSSTKEVPFKPARDPDAGFYRRSGAACVRYFSCRHRRAHKVRVDTSAARCSGQISDGCWADWTISAMFG